MAAQVGHQRAQLVVVSASMMARALDRPRSASSACRQAAPPWKVSAEYRLFGQSSIQARNASPPSRAKAASSLRPYLIVTHVPAHVAEQALDAAEQPVRHDAVQALAVVVDDPPDVADVVLPALQQRLVDVALVQLGVAGDGDVAAGRQVGAAKPVQAGVVGHQGGEAGHGHAQPDRAGGEIDLAAVLDPDGIRLHAAELAQPVHLVGGLPAEQIVDRVEHRPGVRLDGDPVLRAQHLEIQRRQDRDARRAGRLVAADLQPVPVGPDVVGAVDHPRRQPEQFALQLFQDVHMACFGRHQRRDRRQWRVHELSLGPLTASLLHPGPDRRRR